MHSPDSDASFDVPPVQKLFLGRNQIGDAGVTALANACASGSLAKLTYVGLVGKPGNSEPVDKVLRDGQE